MQADTPQSIIEKAIQIVAEASPQQTGGKWLEKLTAQAGPYIKDWDLAQCWTWNKWPEREQMLPQTTSQDIGIDVVAVNRDGEYVAIQCKARELDENGQGGPIAKGEIDSFASASSDSFWAERWLVVNGDIPLGKNAMSAVPISKPIKLVNIANELQQQLPAYTREDCPHCEPNPIGEARQQTKTCMQNEAVSECVRILREHEQSKSGGLPKGQARGKIILPCGTGKTRISLRIIETLTQPGELSIVMCPSIALVAQIRREYLQHAKANIRALAVCSDETAGYNPRKENSRSTASDPTADNSNVSATEVKGKVTTDPIEIADWISECKKCSQVSVIFGTYQSGSRIAQALAESRFAVRVLIGDEAHRTAGLRRTRPTQNAQLSSEEKRVRDFTLCHDNGAFPATYRVYQTATPRLYDTTKVDQNRSRDWIVRSMDDETVFGVELYRKSYVEAVNNGWLSDYRIIALGVNDPEAYRQANRLASNTKSKGRRALTTSDYLRGLAFALAMGGATHARKNGTVPIKSCIAFMNTIDKSKNMAEDLQSDAVRNWLQDWLQDNRDGQAAARFTLEHLDASSNVSARENGKLRLAKSTEDKPHGIINVGIFGEGTDSPSLNAVAFLEARKSPIDVIQAVGRAMRIAPGKDMGYIICPILIPPNADPETWLSTSEMEEGWEELGKILLALRAHDQRIEDNLAELLQLYIPKPPETLDTIVAVASESKKRIEYRMHTGPIGAAQEALHKVLKGISTLSKEFHFIRYNPGAATGENAGDSTPDQRLNGELRTLSKEQPGLVGETDASPLPQDDPTQIIAGKINDDGSIEVRIDTVVRKKPNPDGTRGEVDIKKTKAKGRDMINKGEGLVVSPSGKGSGDSTKKKTSEHNALQMLQLSGLADHGNAIRMNLLAKSGLVEDRVVRDLNILESSVREAAFQLRNDDLQPVLDRHFDLDNLKDDTRRKQADGCTVATLLMMNAAMLHQRIASGKWLTGVSDLEAVKNDVNVVRRVRREWERIMRHDFRPVLEPAVNAIHAVEDTGKLSGLERALRHITAEAERIAETYADMGADHAGPLFNRVMGNQASDGAFFTRPVAASIAARLTLDACGEQDWTNPDVWRKHKTVDLACGSGTLLAAMLTEMKRRAKSQGADDDQIVELQKLAVEESIKGMDINPVSLQLAASQLTAGNHDIRYRQMGLHRMPYGPSPYNPKRVTVGTLELLRQKAIVPSDCRLDVDQVAIASQSVWSPGEDEADLEDAVDAAKDARIVIMNPPFTNRTKMGEKFPKETQQALRRGADALEELLVRADPGLMEFSDKNSIGPLFVALAGQLQKGSDGVVTIVNPTIALSTTSGRKERQVLAQRYHVQLVLTCHQPGQINLSQNTNINESIIVLAQFEHLSRPPTRIVSLDRMPVDEVEVDDLHRCLTECQLGQMPNGWGEVSEWPAERIEAGDWTAAIWRSPELAVAAAKFADNTEMLTMEQAGLSAAATGRLLRGSFDPAEAGPGSFPILKSKGADGQTRIQSQPDEHWIPKNRVEHTSLSEEGTYPETDRILEKAGYLLITAGQRSTTGRLAAVAGDTKYVGNGWMPVAGLTAKEAKAASVFINSTAGRLQLMRNPGRTLDFPTYSTAEATNLRIPNIRDPRIRQLLADCWEQTKDVEVPQYRDGECEVRRLWDEAVAETMGWDADELARLRHLLHQEPHVCGRGYGQYADSLDIDPADRLRFKELADRWEQETMILSNSDRAAEHPAHREIVSMGEAAIPLILDRMNTQGGHWFHALIELTGASPVKPSDRGNVPVMQESWLKWGEANGYV